MTKQDIFQAGYGIIGFIMALVGAMISLLLLSQLGGIWSSIPFDISDSGTWGSKLKVSVQSCIMFTVFLMTVVVAFKAAAKFLEAIE